MSVCVCFFFLPLPFSYIKHANERSSNGKACTQSRHTYIHSTYLHIALYSGVAQQRQMISFWNNCINKSLLYAEKANIWMELSCIHFHSPYHLYGIKSPRIFFETSSWWKLLILHGVVSCRVIFRKSEQFEITKRLGSLQITVARPCCMCLYATYTHY